MDEFFESEMGYTLGIDEAFMRVGHTALLLSRTNAQMLDGLLMEVCRLLEDGVASNQVRVMLPTEIACHRFASLLADAVGHEARSIEVTTPRRTALSILSDPVAQKAIGRRFPGEKARVVLPYEGAFIFEDLKTLGIGSKRLREMIKFIYRGMTELADESDDWLVAKQEKAVVAFLRDELSYLQCALEPELSNLATKAMRRSDAVLSRFTKPYGLVGDYQNLSRASQLLCHLLTTDFLCVVANERCSAETTESYPYREGIEELLRINPNTEARSLDDAERSMEVSECVWEDMNAEVLAVPALVRDRLDRGCTPDRIAVACFHPQWLRNVRHALAAADIPVARSVEPILARADIRDNESSLSARVATALRLLADPTDSLAHRCWMGFGDYLAKSNAFVPHRKETQKLCPTAVLADAGEEDGGRVYPWIVEEPPLARFHLLTGRRLLEALCEALSANGEAKVPYDLAPLIELGDDASASEMVEQLERAYGFAPGDSSGERHDVGLGSVQVLSVEELTACDFDLVILVGMVNGLFPARDYFDLTSKSLRQRERIHRRSMGIVGLIKAASKKIAVSSFASADRSQAELLKLKVERIQCKGGKQFVRTSKSIYASALFEA